MDEEKNEVIGDQSAEQPIELPPATVPPPRKSAAPLIILLILVIAVGIAAYLLVGRGKVWEPAAYMPQEVAMAITLDLSRSADKDAAEQFIRGVLKDAGAEYPEKDLYKEINKALKLDIEKDVLPKLNGSGGIALLTEMSAMTPGIVLVFGARTTSDANDLVTLVDSKLKAQKINGELKKYNTYEYRAYQEAGTPGIICVGAVGDGVLCTLSQTAFEKSVDAYSGKPSLLKNENYNSLRQCGSSTFATAFYSGPGFYKLIGPYLAMGMARLGPDAAEQIKKNMENVIAIVCTATASGDGLGLQAKSIVTQKGSELRSASTTELVNKVPKDAVVAVAASDWKSVWTQAMKEFKAMPSAMNPLGEARKQAKAMLGVDIFDDALNLITSIQAYYVSTGPMSKNKFRGFVGVVLTVDNPKLMAKTLAKLNMAAGKLSGAALTTVDVSGTKFSVLPIEKQGFKLVDAVVDNNVLIALTDSDIKKAAGEALASSQGKGANLSSSKRFEIATKNLPGDGVSLFYGDVTSCLKAYLSEIPAKDRKTTEAISKKFGPVASIYNSSGNKFEMKTALPFIR